MKKRFCFVALAIVCLCGCSQSGKPGEFDVSASAPVETQQQITEPTNDTVELDELFTAVYDAVTSRKGELFLYDYLSQDKSFTFSEYDGSERQKLRIGSNGLYGTTIVADTVYYWHDISGEASPEEAASILITDMLEDIKARGENDFTFTLTNYSVPARQELFDQYDLLWNDVRMLWRDGLTAQELPGIIDTLFPQKASDGNYSMKSDSIAVALFDDMWIFAPTYRYSYKGVCNMYEDGERSSYEYGSDGLLTYSPPDDTMAQYFLLVKNGSVWQMQNWQLARQR